MIHEVPSSRGRQFTNFTKIKKAPVLGKRLGVAVTQGSD